MAVEHTSRYNAAVLPARLNRAARLLRFGTRYLLGGTLQGVGLILTRRCNLRCSYCRIISSDQASKTHELSPEDWMRIVDRFVDHGRLHFIFTGGEPLLYDGLDRVLAHTSKSALTSLITNATLLDADAFSRLRHLDYLTFSWDTLAGDHPGLEKNPAARLPLIVEQCRRYAITPSAIVTVTAANLDDIEPIVTELHARGVSSLLSLIHSGDQTWDFRADVPELTFRDEATQASLAALARRLLTLKGRGVAIAESDAFLHHMVDYVQGRFQMDCPAADDFFTIDVDGRIKACHDTPASTLDARSFPDYEAMRRQVRATVRPGCNCYYDCYFEARNTPLQTVARALRRTPAGALVTRALNKLIRPIQWADRDE